MNLYLIIPITIVERSLNRIPRKHNNCKTTCTIFDRVLQKHLCQLVFFLFCLFTATIVIPLAVLGMIFKQKLDKKNKAKKEAKVQ